MEENISEYSKKNISSDVEKVPNRLQTSENPNTLVLNISSSLKRKLLDKSQREGISVEDLSTELLSEGVVLRAWEIIERKMTMNKSENSYFQKSQNNNYSRSKNYSDNSFKSNTRSSGYSNNQQRKPKYSKIMDDNANFMEYVRNQEKKK